MDCSPIVVPLTELAGDALIWVGLIAISWLSHKTGRALDARWARDHLESVGNRVVDAVLAAGMEYQDRMKAARADGVITDQERRAARRAAMDRALDEVSIEILARALGQSRGRRASTDEARDFIAERVDRELDRCNLRPRALCSDETDDTEPSGSRPEPG